MYIERNKTTTLSDFKPENVPLVEKILTLINIDNVNGCSSFLKIENENSMVTLHVITINPIHEQEFLLKEFVDFTEERVLKNAIAYLEKERHEENSYTVIWTKVSSSRTNTSYFSADDMEEVLKKFFKDKVKKQYIIYEIKLNPIS